MSEASVEPWLRGTLTEIDPVRRQVLHALELAVEDVERWCAPLTDDEINARPAGVAPVAFHLRHIAHSLDRLLTYAEAGQLTETQRLALDDELAPAAGAQDTVSECLAGIQRATVRVRAILPATYDQPRGVGRQMLPSTVAGLLIHCAEHTQRHIGQAITTAKIVAAPSAEAHRS